MLGRPRRLSVVIAASVSLLSLLAQPSYAAPLEISGTVFAPNGAPIPGVAVSDGDHASVTNSGGSYSIQELQFGTYALTASKSGLTGGSASVTLSPTSPSATKNFTLSYRSTLLITNRFISTASGPNSFAVTLKTYAPHPGSCAKITDTRTGATNAMTHTGTEAGQQVWQYSPTLPAGSDEGTFTLTARVDDDCTNGTRIDTGPQPTTYVVDNSSPAFDYEGVRPLHLGNTLRSAQPLVVTVSDELAGVTSAGAAFSVRSLPAGPTTVYSAESLVWNASDGTLASPAVSMIAGTDYQATADVMDRAGNSAHIEWTFRALADPLIQAATGSLTAAGVNTALPGTNPDTLRWRFSPQLRVDDRLVDWPHGSAHPGWGLISTSVQIGAATIRVESEGGVEQVWPISPYATGETATYYQQVAYLDPAGLPAQSLLPALDVRLDPFTIELPGDVVRAELSLVGATVTTRPPPLCVPPPPNSYLCIPDVLPLHVPIGFAERLIEDFQDKPVETVVGIATKLPNPLDAGGTWHELLPASQVACGTQAPNPGDLCWVTNPPRTRPRRA